MNPLRNQSKRKTKKTSKRTRTKKSTTKNSCWKGYHRVKGTAPYSKHSCVKN